MNTNHFIDQLCSFFTGWKNLDERKTNNLSEDIFAEKLSLFFSEWKELPVVEQVEKQPLVVNQDRLANFFTVFKTDEVQQPIQDAIKQGLHLNVWKAAGVGTKEVRNSQILKWFLDWRGDHGQGNLILLRFLEFLSERYSKFKTYKPKNYSTIAECCPLGNIENRVDIEIDAPEFLIFIEVKIYANEGVDQLKRYYRDAMLKTKNLDKDWAIIYLTRLGQLSTSEQVIKESLLHDNDKNTQLIHDRLRCDQEQRLFPLSWAKVAEILNSYAIQAGDNNRSAWLAKQFANHIKTF